MRSTQFCARTEYGRCELLDVGGGLGPFLRQLGVAGWPLQGTSGRWLPGSSHVLDLKSTMVLGFREWGVAVA